MTFRSGCTRAVVALGTTLAFAAGAQTPSGPCGAAPVVARDAQPNIFSDQQEQWLGEAMADSMEAEYTPVRDPSLSAHVQTIADRLVAVLPPTEIKFRVLLVDSSEVNGFSLAGGHIYLTRKLASSAKTDDELAGVIGHEIGHIASHQFAFETTRDLKRLLGVTSLGDRADVYAEYHALMDARMKDKHPQPADTDEKQDEADRIGVYAAAAAGYRPEAIGEFWDRVFFVGGKTGGRLSNFFNITKPTEKRLRGMRQLAATVPKGCGGTLKPDAREFAAWHDAVLANQSAAAAVQSDGAKQVALGQPLRLELDQVRFSPDGTSILAQDESSIFVFSREPLVLRYRIDADGAQAAHFSPDSQSITFSTPGLHTEQWSAHEKKLIAAHELLSRHSCIESKLSPDGQTLVCMAFNPDSFNLGVSMIDTASSEVVWEKKSWGGPSFQRQFLWAHLDGSGADDLFAAYSPDGNILLIGAGGDKTALDFRSRTVSKIGDGILSGPDGEYVFVGPDKLLMTNLSNPKHGAVVSFPAGKQLQTLLVPVMPLASVTNPGADIHALIYGGLDGMDVGLGDLKTGSFLIRLPTHGLDEFGDWLSGETDAGGLGLVRVGETDKAKEKIVTLPLSPLPVLKAVAASPDGHYMAISSRFRGGLWDARTGKRLIALHGFTDASWTDSQTVYLDVVKRGKTERHVVEISLKMNKATDLSYKVDDDVHMRYGRLTELKLDEKKRAWTLALHDPANNSTIWTKQFNDQHIGYTASYGDRDLLFSFGLKTNTAKDAMKANPKLAEEAGAVKDKNLGRLVKVIDGKTGEDAGQLVLEVPANYGGIDGVNRAGDLLYVSEADGRTVVYSMATGKVQRKLFGLVAALDPETGRVCTANRQGEAVVFDAAGSELAHFQLGQPIRYAVLREKATSLLLLTADQMVRTMPVEGRPASAPLEKAEAGPK